MGSIRDNDDYREALREAQNSARRADREESHEERVSWAMSAQAWTDLAREIREGSGDDA